jgi:ubiquinone biosynthesis protein UbiJ
MGRYLTPLPAMLAGTIDFVLDRAAALDPQAAETLAPLTGRWLKFELQGPGIDLWFGVDDGRFRVRAEHDQPADTVIAGTPAALAAMALPQGAGGGVRIEGDARLAQQFQAAVRALDPDIERALSEYFGTLFGPQMYRAFVDATAFGRHAAETGVDQVSRWLREESALVPRPGEWRDFRDGVDRLREAVDRLERKARASGT